MKVLYNKDGTLKWFECMWNGKEYRVCDTAISENTIMSVRDIKKKMWVRCTGCGEIIRNTPASIRKHKERGADSSYCFKCSKLGINERKVNIRNFTKNENGEYSMVKKAEVTLTCNNNRYYRIPRIDSHERLTTCQYARCHNAEFEEVKGFFEKYPEAFDKMATVDAILQNGYHERHVMSDKEAYRLKGRNDITALINKQNIITHFDIYYKGNYFKDIHYSAKYDKLFKYDAYSNSLREWTPDIYEMPSTTYNYIKSKIASLYT